MKDTEVLKCKDCINFKDIGSPRVGVCILAKKFVTKEEKMPRCPYNKDSDLHFLVEE